MGNPPTILPKQTSHSILITTITIGERPAVDTTIVSFPSRDDALEALFHINNHHDAQGRYEQEAIPLFR